MFTKKRFQELAGILTEEVMQESEWEKSTSYDLTSADIEDGGWEVDHEDPMSGIVHYKRLKPGLRKTGTDPKSGMDVIKGKPVDELPETADDYDGHPGPQYELTHKDPKSGIGHYKLKSAIRRDKRETR